MTDPQMQYKRKTFYHSVTDWGNPGVTVTQAVGPFYGLKRYSSGGLGTPDEGWWRPPLDLDITKPIGIKVHFTCTGTTITSVSFIGLAEWKPVDSSNLLEATADDALNKVIATSQTVTTELSKNLWTARGQIAANLITRAQLDAGALLQFSIELDAAGGTADTSNAVYILGVEFDYAVKAHRGAPDYVDQPYNDVLI